MKPDALQQVFDYHQQTKHNLERYAPGPGYMDWATQPDPFRRYAGAQLVPLEKIPSGDGPSYDEVFVEGTLPPSPLSRTSLSQLFYHSLAISAWKSIPESSWALRVNPSSGNLHPTEGYLICGPVQELFDRPVCCHYAPKEHGLEVRAEIEPELWTELAERFPPNTFYVGLTSIHWREAWKYGQRAYRYCQHDTGHAIGAVSIAAAGLGWQTRILDDLGTDALASLMGTNGEHDAEPEEPDVLMAIGTFEEGPREAGLTEEFHLSFRASTWQGHPNQLSPSQADWGMDEIAKAARKPHRTPCYESAAESPRPRTSPVRPISLRRMIRQRRSAVAMDAETHLSRDTFYRILQKTLAVPGNVPFETMPWKPHIHLAIFVHRVEDLSSGLYFLVRDSAGKESLQQAITRADQWCRPTGCPEHLDLFLLVEGDARDAARQISCFQEIASDSSFSLGMIAEYEEPLKRYGPSFYPRLFWEAGGLGQVLYLEAEAAGVRSTGIGCYFDDPMHELLGLKDRKFQDLYHFTIGGPVEDTRLTTLASYPDETV